ncbi:MAG: TonB-dependent receptor [Bacteroidota bacterium]
MRKSLLTIEIFTVLSFSALGQQTILDEKITLRIENQSVAQALQTISEKTSYTFNYFANDLPKNRRVTRSYTGTRLEDVLRDVWGENALTLRVQGNTVDFQSNAREDTSPATGTLTGRVADEKNEPLPGVTVLLLDTKLGAITNAEGQYRIDHVPADTHQLEVSFVGFAKITQTVTVPAEGSLAMDFTLEESASELDEIVVTGATVAKEVSLQPIRVTSVDLKPIQSQVIEIARVLDDLPGIRVRQSGGFGSRTQVQLNGATGNAVRGYFDGIPFEYIANGGSINNIPVNLIDRIDVYKGVTPITIGTDALAGGINFVTKQVYNDLLDVSYEVGSFNTHRATLNTYLVKDSSFFVGLNSFYNFSENNYKMDVTNFVFGKDQEGEFNRIVGTENIRAERFHDAHQSYYAEIHTGLRGQKWADDLSYRVAYLSRYDETQHGARVTDQPSGDADQTEYSIAQRLSYSKNELLDGLLDITYQGTFNFLNQVTNDSTADFHNWRGEVIENFRGSQNSSEVTPNPTARDIEQLATSQRLNLSFNLLPNHQLMFTNFYGRQRLEGEDPLIVGDDPNQIPAILEKNISGIAYKSKWLNETLIATLFGKYYHYTSEANDLFAENNSASQVIRRGDNIWGYGAGIKWVVNDDLFIRSSYEEAVRIPTPLELVGDFVRARSNPFLRPEQSNNWNIGLVYSKYLDNQSSLSIDFNSFLQYTDNLIFFDANELTLGQFINQGETQASGVELALGGTFRKSWRGQLNITKQQIIDSSEGNPTSGLPIPNRPDFFISSSVAYTADDWFTEDRLLTFNWFVNYIDEFNFILTGGRRRDENFVPTQFINDFSITYQIRDKGLSFSVQVNNIFDEEVFDFISVPRPGRNFRFKIRYALNNF